MIELTLGLRRDLTDEEVAGEVIIGLRRNWVYLPQNLYRGVNANDEVLERIRKTGTDRCSENHQAAALLELERMQRDYEDVTIEDALFATDPTYTWLNEEKNLDESVKWAKNGSGQPTILIYDGKIRLNQSKKNYIDYYRFHNPATSYLIAMISLK